MPLKSDYNHIICIMEGETKNIRFVLKIYRFVLRLLNISFCGLYLHFTILIQKYEKRQPQTYSDGYRHLFS